MPSSGENIKSLMFLGGSMIQAAEGWESWAVLSARFDLGRVSTSLGWARPSLPWAGGHTELGLPLLALPPQSFPSSALLCLPPWELLLINPQLMPRGCCCSLVLNAKLLPDGALGLLGMAGSRFCPLFLSLCPNTCPNYCSCGLAAAEQLRCEF